MSIMEYIWNNFCMIFKEEFMKKEIIGNDIKNMLLHDLSHLRSEHNPVIPCSCWIKQVLCNTTSRTRIFLTSRSNFNNCRRITHTFLGNYYTNAT